MTVTLTAFTSRLGVGHGRLLAVPGSESENDHVFVLGERERGRLFNLAPGDRAEVTQTVDLTGVVLVRAALSLDVPESVPMGLAWEASVVVDGVKLASARARRGRERVLTDLAVNVSKANGVHTVGVRLELVTE